MRTFQTTTRIAPIVSVGTYWGWFDYDSLWTSQEASEREEGRYVCQDYSRTRLGEAIVHEANSVFAREEPFKDVGVLAVRATAFGSPREYNFGDDWLDLEFDVADDFLDRAEKKIFDPKYEERFEKYIRERWRSRDGFISSMPADSLPDMHEVFRQLREDDCGIDDMRCFGSVVALLYEAERQDGELADCEDDAFGASLTGMLLEQVTENHSLSEFCTILEPGEVYSLYPAVRTMLERVDRSVEALSGELALYLETDIPEESKRRVSAEVDRRVARIRKFEDDAREIVESHHPARDMVEGGVVALEDEWIRLFGEDGGDACAKDLPGQMKLPGMEDA